MNFARYWARTFENNLRSSRIFLSLERCLESEIHPPKLGITHQFMETERYPSRPSHMKYYFSWIYHGENINNIILIRFLSFYECKLPTTQFGFHSGKEWNGGIYLSNRKLSTRFAIFTVVYDHVNGDTLFSAIGNYLRSSESTECTIY